MKHLTRQNQFNCQDKLNTNSSILAGTQLVALGQATKAMAFPPLVLGHNFLGVKSKEKHKCG